MNLSSRWIVAGEVASEPRLRLFCLPYAGGGASIYRRWQRLLGPAIQVCAVQLPGREDRLDDPPCPELAPLLDGLLGALRPWLDRPWAVFGHSLGARLAYEVAAAVEAEGGRAPIRVFASAAAAPHVPPRARPIHALPQPEFVAELRRLGGTPEAILAHSELMEILTPVLRADFRLDERHGPTRRRPLSAPITALGGRADATVDLAGLAAWEEYTRGPFTLGLFEGDHFFLHAQEAALVERVREALEAGLAEPRRAGHPGAQPEDRPGECP